MARLDRRFRLAIAAFALVVVVVAGVGLSTSAASFSTYNSGWDGSAGLQDVATDAGSDIVVATTPARYNTTDASTAFVVAPETSYSQSEIRTIRSYVAEGGTLVVAGDFSRPANELLRGLGTESRLNGRLLRDEQHYYRSPNLTVATNVRNQSVTTNVSQLTLNYGTAIDPGNATVLASSSNFSYLDTNANGEIDASESLGSRAVVTRESVGNGTVVVVSDPSLFINAMVDRPDNRQFVRNLVADEEQVLVDASHQKTVPPLAAALLAIEERPLLTGFVGLLGVGGLGLLLRHGGIEWVRKRVREDDPDDRIPVDALAQSVAASNPEWDADDVREVIKEVINTDR
ncbi:hypothetical protein C455_09738 [Haloferax larsenii JCM 13917]|nr:DUF4350 domain-containing protein [Haloferax larsenii]ELZ77955.1 hypothetical protein C455_09738 [Haloferax larsenii JCM 13917]